MSGRPIKRTLRDQRHTMEISLKLLSRFRGHF